MHLGAVGCVDNFAILLASWLSSEPENIDKEILQNIDKEILQNIDIDKEILQNI